LAALLASAKNLIVLDEPTNHLDIPSAERLEQALKQTEDGDGYQGTLILISHDRALIDATCDHLLVFDGAGNVEVFHGNYAEHHRKQVEKQKAAAAAASAAEAKAAKAQQQQQQQRATEKKPDAVRPAEPVVAPKKKASDKGPRPNTGLAWMPLERLEGEVARCEKAVKDADARLADPKVYMDPDACREALSDREKAGAELARHESEWLYRMDE
jgi:ATPase subunit of ABC transporter with duplicated ATPase domains